jgi:type II secretory pathway pseudopilin PulG
MKTSAPRRRPATAGFTLVEAMITMSIAVTAISLTLGTFLFGLRTMYKDNVRLETNSNLRSFMAQMTKETLDASEFYIFPDYEALDGSVDIDNGDGVADTSTLTADSYGTTIAHGDCVVLVTRTSLAVNANVREIRIYYRVAKTSERNSDKPLRYYSRDWGSTGTTTALATLLNAINLKSNPNLSGSREIIDRAKGRRIGSTSNYYPIFCSEAPTITATNESFSINVEFINGTDVNNLLSSSSFNYTISPRR